MRKGSGKDVIVVLDGYSMREIVRYPSVVRASEDLNIKSSTIRSALCHRTLVFECYFVYLLSLEGWKPAQRSWRRIRGNKESEKLNRLRKEKENVWSL